jgi:hypothetical protein
MSWRHEHPSEIFERGLYERLQLLIHPIWWTERPQTFAEKWAQVLQNCNLTILSHWKQRERTFAALTVKPPAADFFD